MQELVRYIHLNPLRAKMVDDLKALDSYPYCGHSVLMGKKKIEWQGVEYVLGYFGKRIGAARKSYRSYIEEGIPLGRRPELVGGGLIRSLGGWDEIKKMRLTVQDSIKSDQRIWQVYRSGVRIYLNPEGRHLKVFWQSHRCLSCHLLFLFLPQ